MTTVTNLIATIEKYGTVKQGQENVNKNGVRYRYDYCEINSNFAPKWMIQLFEQAKIEVYGTNDTSKLVKMGADFRAVKVDDISIYCNYATNKSQPCGKITYNKLVKL